MHRKLWLLILANTVALCALAADDGTARAPDSRAVMTGDQIVQILDETVDWYRTLGVQQQAATQPSDLLILYANRQIADKVMALALADKNIFRDAHELTEAFVSAFTELLEAAGSTNGSLA